jgi:hypothetical protein
MSRLSGCFLITIKTLEEVALYLGKKLSPKFRRLAINDEEAEGADFLVCQPANAPAYFLDNLPGRCAHCDCPIVYRPHAPSKPKKLCFACFSRLTQYASPN